MKSTNKKSVFNILKVIMATIISLILFDKLFILILSFFDNTKICQTAYTDPFYYQGTIFLNNLQLNTVCLFPPIYLILILIIVFVVFWFWIMFKASKKVSNVLFYLIVVVYLAGVIFYYLGPACKPCASGFVCPEICIWEPRWKTLLNKF